MSLTRCMAAGVRVLQRLLHAAELAVEHLPAQQVAELLERLPGRLRPPVVVGELPDGARGVVGSASSSASRSRASSLGSGNSSARSCPMRRVEQLAGLVEHAVEPAAVAQLALPLADPAQQVVQAARGPASRAAAGRAARPRGLSPPRMRSPMLVERLPDVIRRRQRVRPAVVRPYR